MKTIKQWFAFAALLADCSGFWGGSFNSDHHTQWWSCAICGPDDSAVRDRLVNIRTVLFHSAFCALNFDKEAICWGRMFGGTPPTITRNCLEQAYAGRIQKHRDDYSNDITFVP